MKLVSIGPYNQAMSILPKEIWKRLVLRQDSKQESVFALQTFGGKQFQMSGLTEEKPPKTAGHHQTVEDGDLP